MMSLRANLPPNHALPPISPITPSDSPDWSPLNNYGYASGNPPPSAPPTVTTFAAKSSIPHPIDTPPLSVHSSANSSAPDGPLHQRPNGNPSPPSSIGRAESLGRASVITTATIDDKKYQEMETTLAGHHQALLRFLAPYLRDLRADPRQDRARDKLQRLSMSQFQELSTDVFDELTRRDEERRRGTSVPGNVTPKYLLPRQNFHVKRNQARQKLSTLPTDRFQQLATDVFFELERRFPRFGRSQSRADSIADRNTSSRNGAYPPRAGSRMGNTERSISREGFRNGPYGQPGIQPGLDDQANNLGKPLPKLYQSNVILPNKGTMVEDDSEVDSLRSPMNNMSASGSMNPQQKAQIESLEKKVDDLIAQLEEKDRLMGTYVPREKMEDEQAQWDDVKSSLERKLKDAQNLNDSLKAEVDKIRSDNMEMERKRGFDNDLQSQLDDLKRKNQQSERNFRDQLEDIQSEARQNEDNLLRQLDEARNQPVVRGFDDGGEWKDRCEMLEREVNNQRKITDEVRNEASQFLQEMRTLSQRTTESVEKEEKLLDQVVALEREVRVWKSRYAKSKSHARSLRSSSLGLSSPNGTAAEFARDNAFVAQDGLVRDVHVMSFQVAIDDLLQQARGGDEQLIIDSMKQVVLAIRSITVDMDSRPAADDGAQNRLTKLRYQLSQAANNLITATKSHSASAGIAPVSLVDAAASHVTAAVVEVVRTLKIRQSSAEELEQEEASIGETYTVRPAPLNTRGKGSISTSSQTSGVGRNGSVSSTGYSNYSRYSSRYSINTSPPATGENMPGFGVGQTMGMLREDGIQEFKNYLEDTSSLLVRSIQPLVNTIRSQPTIVASDPAVVSYVSEISITISEMVTKSNKAVADLSNKALNKHAPPVINLLDSTARELTATKDRGDVGGMPQLAFKLARATKELLWRVSRIEDGEITADTQIALEL